MRKIFLLLFLSCPFFVQGQHHKHKKPEKVSPADTVKAARQEMLEMEDQAMPVMKSLTSSRLSMNFDGSGTSWQPEESPIAMYMHHGKHSQLSLNGAAYLRYTDQDITNKGVRGDKQFNSANWLMGMWRYELNESNILSAQSMISLEPFTIGEQGSPLLFQTGETYKGEPIVDYQHPHDLFMGMALMYTHSFSSSVEVTTTAGYPFEPALGPPAFMHRQSSLMLPDAPLGHHWQDATHISYGVATLGLRIHRVKMEGSLFNGREPDEKRYDFDDLRMDSYSFRFTWNPVHTLSMQISTGFLESPEVLHPHEDIQRSTFSVIHTRKLDPGSFIATTLAVGVNDYSESPRTRSFLLESMLTLKPVMITGRYELTQKEAEDLNLHSEPQSVYDLHTFTLGVGRQLNQKGPVIYRAGVNASMNLTDNRVEDVYGKNPWSMTFFILLTPPFMDNSDTEYYHR